MVRFSALLSENRAGYESPGEDSGWPPQIVSVNRPFPFWLCPRQRHNRRNLRCQAAAREVSSCQQETLHGFCRPREGVWYECLRRSSGGCWENLMWRSGLWDWSRGCMQMRGAVSLLMLDTVMSLMWRSVFTKAQYSARCFSSLCLKPCHASSALGAGRTSMVMTLLS